MIRLEHIYKDFETNNPAFPIHHVLKDLNLTIQDGDFVTVIGSNGSGKSTLLNTIAGSLRPTSGKVFFDDKDVTDLKDYQRAGYIGRVFQDPTIGTIGDITIEENLALALRRGEKRTLRWALKKEYLDIYKEKLSPLNLGLENRMQDRISSLSGGQRQSVTLLMAALKKPKLLLLDEHTAALDPKTSKKILTLTDTLIKENNLTAMMITHNMRDALTYGNRLIMISDGKVIADIAREEKDKLTIEDLYRKFDEAEAEMTEEADV
ncbi:MAG: ATP-binding cassette domain-containing protein [Bacilli bacterium]|jgi:putative ABC transport system ATP-binding protein|nr:ATP-binding cassette domain-containing protein [Bacilli bacterium]